MIAVAAAALPLLAAVLVAQAEPDSHIEAARSAVKRALPLIEKSSAEYTRQRACFSCHHQAMPVFALSIVRKHGFQIDDGNFREQLKFTENSLRGGRDSYRQGRGQGGQVDTAGYALLALEAGEWKPDDTTEAAAEYLLLRDAQTPFWRTSANRPPSELSNFTATALAVRALKTWSTAEQKERADARIEKAREWLRATSPKDTEERVFRLWGLKYASGADEQLRDGARELRESQRADGGWSQTGEMESDAYATGSALAALHLAGALPVTDPVYGRGLDFLTRSQETDGSWHVRSRSTPFQTYFETGFPHGKDQFISTSATCWATAALALACPGTP